MRTAKRQASKHAEYGWTCPCGRRVFGNGGISSHRRACLTWKRDRYVRTGRALMSGMYDGNRPSLKSLERTALLDFERLRVELRGGLPC